jgi:hypothetical protein
MAHIAVLEITATPTHTVKVWTKGLKSSEVDRLVNELDKESIDRVARQVVADYEPPSSVVND